MSAALPLADELARVRAELDAARTELDRLRRVTDSRRGGCCRDTAAQAWAEADVLRARLTRYAETHENQAATIRGQRVAIKALRDEMELLREEITALRAPTPARRLRFRNH